MKNIFMLLPLLIFGSLAVFTHNAYALTPIARVDVIPFQRINQGEIFNFGVVAFHKEGIDKVDFTISGQGYTGGIKTASEMTLNPRTDVWEYWVPISASEFTSDGVFSVTATAFGKDGDTRVLNSISLLSNVNDTLTRYDAWVDVINGSDTSGQVGDQAHPFQTIAAAVNATQTANGGKSDGNTIYLAEGVYPTLGWTTTNTSNEWLTIAAADGASKENTILDGGGSTQATKFFKVQGLTIRSSGQWDYVISNRSTYLWVDDCRIIGAGRAIAGSNPIQPREQTWQEYYTNNYYFDMDLALSMPALARGNNIYQISNDAYQFPLFVINSVVDDIDNSAQGTAYPHADVIQLPQSTVANTFDVDNIIVYGIKATNLHYQGIFVAANNAYQTKNTAFVNNLFEMRDPVNYGGANWGGMSILGNNYDHLVFWNNSFLGGHLILSETISNSSFVGNTFWQLILNDENLAEPNPSIFRPDNSENNEALYNHYENVNGITLAENCSTNDNLIKTGAPCPHWYAKRPDSDENISSTVGEGEIIIDYQSPDFAKPTAQSLLIDRFPSITPADIDGNPRGSTSDIGAYDHTGATAPELIGDVDNDGTVNTIDAFLVSKISLNLSMASTNWLDSETRGDVNCDETINTTDALLILRYSLGLAMTDTTWCGN